MVFFIFAYVTLSQSIVIALTPGRRVVGLVVYLGFQVVTLPIY